MRHSHDQEIDPEVVAALLAGLEGGHAGVCLSDSEDYVRYVNAAFRAVFFPNAPNVPFEFTEALANAINAGMGIKLNSMSLEDFVPRVRERRRSGSARYDFSVDMIDGTWWWVNDHRLPNGWTLVVATEISSLKEEEFRLRAAHSAAVKETQVDGLTGTQEPQARPRPGGGRPGSTPGGRHPVHFGHPRHRPFQAYQRHRGHMVGDEVLTHFAQALATRFSSLDHVTRLGGEEFLVTMSSTSEEMALARLERLIRSLTPQLEMGANRPELKYSFSAGIALARGPDTR